MRLIVSGVFSLEKYWKIGSFSGRIQPDWGCTARADMAGLGSIGFFCVFGKDINGGPGADQNRV